MFGANVDGRWNAPRSRLTYKEGAVFFSFALRFWQEYNIFRKNFLDGLVGGMTLSMAIGSFATRESRLGGAQK